MAVTTRDPNPDGYALVTCPQKCSRRFMTQIFLTRSQTVVKEKAYIEAEAFRFNHCSNCTVVPSQIQQLFNRC